MRRFSRSSGWLAIEAGEVRAAQAHMVDAEQALNRARSMLGRGTTHTAERRLARESLDDASQALRQAMVRTNAELAETNAELCVDR